MTLLGCFKKNKFYICKKNQQIKFLLNNITTIETSLPIDSSIEFYEENKTDYYVGEQRKYYLNEIFHQQIIEKPPPRANVGYSCSGGNAARICWNQQIENPAFRPHARRLSRCIDRSFDKCT